LTPIKVAPDGNQVEISRELFGALWDFLQGNQPTGSVVTHFRNRGIAALEAIIKKTYKYKETFSSRHDHRECNTLHHGLRQADPSIAYKEIHGTR
jgi:hypothetical protein